MPNTTSATWPSLTAGQVARASDVESKFDWSETHLWPHSGGNFTDNTYDLGNSVTASWRCLYTYSINATSTARGLAIGTTTVANNSDVALEVAGTRSFITPRVSTAQRDNWTGRDGMFIYNSTTAQFQGYVNGAWTVMGGSPIGAIKLTVYTASNSLADALNISTSGRLRALTAISTAGASSKSELLQITIDGAMLMSNATMTIGTTGAYLGYVGVKNDPDTSASFFMSAGTATTSYDYLAPNIDLYFKTSLRVEHRSTASGAGGTTGVSIFYERA